MNFIEAEYPNVKKWTLCTPYKNLRNQHFYEKFGYEKVGEHKVTDNLSLIDYLKETL
jgi:ribosomal protein S18 acetylase RimI-like enzyme